MTTRRLQQWCEVPVTLPACLVEVSVFYESENWGIAAKCFNFEHARWVVSEKWPQLVNGIEKERFFPFSLSFSWRNYRWPTHRTNKSNVQNRVPLHFEIRTRTTCGSKLLSATTYFLRFQTTYVPQLGPAWSFSNHVQISFHAIHYQAVICTNKYSQPCQILAWCNKWVNTVVRDVQTFHCSPTIYQFIPEKIEWLIRRKSAWCPRTVDMFIIKSNPSFYHLHLQMSTKSKIWGSETFFANKD